MTVADRPGDEFRLRPADNLLEALGGQMVAFVHNEMAVIAHAILDDALADQALDDRDIQRAGQLPLAAADPANRLRRQAEKRRQSLDPLFQQLPAMHENQRVDAALGNEPCRHDGFSESRRGGQNARVVGQHRSGGGLLLGPQFTLELHIQRRAGVPLIADDRLDAQVRQELLHLVQTAARQADVLRHDPRHKR